MKKVAVIAAALLAVVGGVFWLFCARIHREIGMAMGEAMVKCMAGVIQSAGQAFFTSVASSSKEADKTKFEWEQRSRKGADAADKGHTKVQLWAEGPYWADTNIGAEKPWESGYYFWWGDTIGYKLENNACVASDGSSRNFSFVSDHTPTYGKGIDSLRKEGWISVEGVLSPEHDAAHVKWGGKWRLPTKQELADLFKNCDWTWIRMNGVSGYVFVVEAITLQQVSFSLRPVTATGLRSTMSVRAATTGHPFRTRAAATAMRGASTSIRATTARTTYRDSGHSVRPVQGFTK